MNSNVYKWCMVPQCNNTSIKTPNKLFVYVPTKKAMRYKWLTLARRDPTALSVNTSMYFCEDHFDLTKDMDNYMEYHVMGSVSQVRMKPGCIPTKFACQTNRRKRTAVKKERPYIVKKQRQALVKESEKDLEERSITKKHLELGEASSSSSDEVPSKRKYQEPTDQYAVDAHGRRRFHGAFTGGFSAFKAENEDIYVTEDIISHYDSMLAPARDQLPPPAKLEGPNVSMRGQAFGVGEIKTEHEDINATEDMFHDDFTLASARDQLPPPAKLEGPNVSMRVQALGVGAIKTENEDIYVTEDMSHYDSTLAPARDKLTPPAKREGPNVSICGLAFDVGEIKVENEDINTTEDMSHYDFKLTPARDQLPPPAKREGPNVSIRGQAFGVGAIKAENEDIDVTEEMSYNDFTLAPARDQLPPPAKQEGPNVSIRGQAFGVGEIKSENEDMNMTEDMSHYDFTLAPATEDISHYDYKLAPARDQLTPPAKREGPNNEEICVASLAEALLADSGSEYDEEEEMTKEQLQELLKQDDDDVDADIGDSHESFTWSADFATFRGEREEFHEEVGPKIEGTSPLDLFTQIWDQPLMESIVMNTNSYACEKIATACETGNMPSHSRVNAWKETTVGELYRLIAVFILMSLCQRGRIDEYWTTGALSMPGFRKLMSINRFLILLRFLHFVDNATVDSHGEDRKLSKIKPVLDYLNRKFQSVYTPRREVSIGESLLLWKGHLGWMQCIRTKAARSGLKSYELCEAASGYVLNIIIYTGKDTTPVAPIHGFTESTAKIVLNVFQKYLGKGYTLFMDNFFNSVSLCRFLKTQKTDVVGTLNRRRADTPTDIKQLNETIPRGSVVSRHCGDVSVFSWKDAKLVTTVSTYHKDSPVESRRASQNVKKPEVIETYNKFMTGVDHKDEKLSMYLIERKRGIKWYIKVFRRLLNVAILNSYVIHTANIGQDQKLSHRQFRYRLAEELVQRFGTDSKIVQKAGVPLFRLDLTLNHFPENTPVTSERTKSQDRFKRGRCARCAVKKERKTSSISCSQCKVFLCVGQCWSEFHTQETL